MIDKLNIQFQSYFMRRNSDSLKNDTAKTFSFYLKPVNYLNLIASFSCLTTKKMQPS